MANLTQSVPVGICSYKRARWLGMAASVGGGAIYVSLPYIPGLNDSGLLAVGRLPSGEAVADLTELEAGEVLKQLRAELERLETLARKHPSLTDMRDCVGAVLFDLKEKVGQS